MKNHKSKLSADEVAAINALATTARRQIPALTMAGKGTVACVSGEKSPASAAALRVVLAVANGTPYMRALNDIGMRHIAFMAEKSHNASLGLLFEAAKRLRNAAIAAKAEMALDKLLTTEGCEINAKAVIFALERLDCDTFSKPKEDAPKDTGGKTTYNIFIGGKPAAGATIVQPEPAIDVESE